MTEAETLRAQLRSVQLSYRYTASDSALATLAIREHSIRRRLDLISKEVRAGYVGSLRLGQRLDFEAWLDSLERRGK